MYCSNLARSPAIYVLSGISIRPKCSNYSKFDRSSLSIQFRPKTLNPNRVRPKTLESSSTKLRFQNFLVGARVFCTSIVDRTGGNGAGKALPWIAGYKDREGRRGEKRVAVKTSRSSWVDSAESYFSRNDERDKSNASVESKDSHLPRNGMNRESREERGNSSSENVRSDDAERETREAAKNFSRNGRSMERREERRNLNEESATEEDEDEEAVYDPRWDGIRSRYRGFVDREARFEKPEVRKWNKQENWGRKVWKEAKESSIPKMVGQGVYGVGPILAALTVERREFYALYVQEGLDLSGNTKKRKDKKGVEKVMKLAEKLGLKVVEASKHDLNMMVDSRPHQGLVLDASPLEMVNVKALEAVSTRGKRAPVWVALDEVTDPQNLGAIVRSSYYFGVEGVVLCAKNSAPLSGVVSKASAGSLELIELRSCKNMMQFLSSSIENGWRVLGGSVSSKARPLSEVEDGIPTILVLGSEGSGLRPLVERSCTELVRIPGNLSMDECAGEDELEADEMDHSGKGQELKSFLAVESLNVSVAAGVLLYHLVGNNNNLNVNKANSPLQL